MSEHSFKPAWWLRHAHMQTLWPTLCRSRIKNLPLTEERIELPDGDFIDLTWIGQQTKNPTVILLHGLAGSIDSPYAKGMLNAVYRQGWRGVLMHFRGCSREHNRLPRAYHSGDTADVDFIVKKLMQREESIPFAAIGFSLGGNVLLKWLGETGYDNPLSAAVAISVPFELQKTTKRIHQGFSRVYEKYLLMHASKKVKAKFEIQACPIDIPFEKISSLRDFDHLITAPLHGFLSAEDYYEKSSSRQFLHAIRIPTLIIQAKDDPFMSHDLLPEAHELSSSVRFELTNSGGHVGFITGKIPWRPQYWLEYRVPQFLQSYFKS